MFNTKLWVQLESDTQYIIAFIEYTNGHFGLQVFELNKCQDIRLNISEQHLNFNNTCGLLDLHVAVYGCLGTWMFFPMHFDRHVLARSHMSVLEPDKSLIWHERFQFCQAR